jgi:hypothetical protein
MLMVCSFMVAADEELPEIEFIEYLGLWEDSDEDWVLFSDSFNADKRAKNEQRSDPAPEGEESTEKDDES